MIIELNQNQMVLYTFLATLATVVIPILVLWYKGRIRFARSDQENVDSIDTIQTRLDELEESAAENSDVESLSSRLNNITERVEDLQDDTTQIKRRTEENSSKISDFQDSFNNVNETLARIDERVKFLYDSNGGKD